MVCYLEMKALIARSFGLKRNVLTQLPVLSVALFVRKQSHHGSGVARLHWSHDEIVFEMLVIDLS